MLRLIPPMVVVAPSSARYDRRDSWITAGSFSARAVVFCAAAVCASSCANHRPVSVEVHREQLLERNRGFAVAVAAKDLEKTSAYFSHEALIHAGDRPPVAGRNAIRQFYSKVFAFLATTEITADVVRVATSGDMAYVTGGAVNVFNREGDTVKYHGTYMLVWERRESDWMIAMYSLSSDGPTR